MSSKFRRILVALRDVHHVPIGQLRKAAGLAKACGARLELFHAISESVAMNPLRRGHPHLSFTATRQAIATQLSQRLERLATSAEFRGVKVTTTALWDYPPHEAIVRRALTMKADLVVAGRQPRGWANRFLLANTDWELIRQCPCPVLLVKSSRQYDRPVVLAAVDPFHKHDKPARLDRRLLQVGGAVAHCLRGELQVCHAYLPLALFTPAPLGQPLAITLPPEFEGMHTQQVSSVFNDLAARAGIPARRRHLRMGVTQSQLLGVVRGTGAQIIVMGAVSRSALQRAFIGSTAESALDALTCDVLVVKPAGFRTRVQRRRAPLP